MQDKAAFQYSNVQISTIDRGRLLLMMYDGGLKFLKQAKAGLENGDIVKFARFLSKSQAIIAELMNTLDFERGGVIAKDLDRLYDFMLFYLTEANLQKDPKKVQRVIGLLETIASAYRDIILGNKSEHGALNPSSIVTHEPAEASAPGQMLRVSY
jgi:flagellar secretion chaperone FliS